MADLNETLDISLFDDITGEHTEVDSDRRLSIALKTPAGKISGKDEGGGSISLDTNIRSGRIRLYDALGNEVTINENRLRTNVVYDKSILTAFGNLTVANPHSLYEFDFVNGEAVLNEMFSTLTATGGTVGVASNNIPGISLTVTGTTGSRAVIQTKEYIHYQSGKEHRIMWTCQSGAGISGIRKREGYFSNNNGLYFENNGTDYSVNILSSITGSSLISIPRASWDDPFNGNGPSGLNVDFTKFWLKYIRFSWLGTNMVEFGVVYNQSLIPCHTFNFGGLFEYPYMRSPHLPFRFEIENVGSATGSTLTPVCGSVASMGGREENYLVKSADNNDFVQHDSGEYRLLIAIRLKAAYNRAKVRSMRFYSSTNSNGQYRYTVWKNPTFVGTPTWTSAGADSFVEYAIRNGNTQPYITAGTKLISDSIIVTNNVKDASSMNLEIPLNSDINGTSDIIAFTVNGTANGLHFASAQWKEMKG